MVSMRNTSQDVQIVWLHLNLVLKNFDGHSFKSIFSAFCLIPFEFVLLDPLN